MVGEHRAQASSSRRGRGWSGASVFVFGQKLFDYDSGGYGSPLVEGVRILEAALEGVSGGEAGGRSAACVRLSQERALAFSGH